MAKRGKQVRNTIQPKGSKLNTTQPLPKANMLAFDFSYYQWLKSVKLKEFTNMISDECEFTAAMIDIFRIIFPIVQTNWNIIKLNIKTQFPHCHSLSKDKIDLVEKIAEQIHGKKLRDTEDTEDLNYWQLGINQSLRIITLYNHNTNTMYPIFIDYHHQIHPSVKYNEKDIDKYELCPYTKYS